MPVKLSDETQQAIIKDLEDGLSYAEITKKYGLKSKSIITRIKREHLSYIKQSSPANLRTSDNPKTRKKMLEIQNVAFVQEVQRKSDIIVGNIIDVLEGLKYSAQNLIEINEHARAEIEQINSKLANIIANLEEIKNGADEETKNNINTVLIAARTTLSNISNYYQRQKIRIDAINSLKEQFKVFFDYEIMAKTMMGVKQLIKDIFETLNIINDNEYVKFRDELIRRNPATQGLFEQYEADMDRPQSDKQG